MRLRIAIVLAVLAAALLLPGFARAESGQGTSTEVAATVNGFADGNGTPDPGSTDGFSDGNSGATTGATDGPPAADDGGSVAANFGMSDGNG